MDEYTIDYNEQMLNYLPEIFKTIREFRALIASHSVKIEELHEELPTILSNAYICDANDTTIAKWENYLGIVPSQQGTLTDEVWLEQRKNVILAKLYSPEKLNSESIANTVNIFTGGTTISYFKNGTITVLVTPPQKDTPFSFEDIKAELRNKIPAHLTLDVRLNYWTWGEVNSRHTTWDDVANPEKNSSWDDLLYRSLTEME